MRYHNPPGHSGHNYTLIEAINTTIEQRANLWSDQLYNMKYIFYTPTKSNYKGYDDAYTYASGSGKGDRYYNATPYNRPPTNPDQWKM